MSTPTQTNLVLPSYKRRAAILVETLRAQLPRHGWLLLWLAVVVVNFLIRGPIPIDETRYLGAAWEMWQRGDYLVPHLNGAPYSDKPPLLFWLFHAGWWLFGVNEWWPRLVPPLFALGALYLVARIGRILWPGDAGPATLAPWILAGSMFWAAYTPITMFDMPLTALVLLGLVGVLRAASGRFLSGWLLLAAATGAGILMKGPVMLLHVAASAMLAPWWSATARTRPLAWYGGLLAAIALGVGIALAWALPAAVAGGPEYARAILWQQTTGRMIDSFAHQRPVWWYLPLLPLLLFPWLLWPPFWRGMQRLCRGTDASLRFLLSGLIPVFAILSLLSGKQVYYLLPLFPALALVVARALAGTSNVVSSGAQVLPASVLVAGGFGVHLVRQLDGPDVAEWLTNLDPLWGIALICAGLVLVLRDRMQPASAVRMLSVAGVTLAVLLTAAVMQAAHPAYDLGVPSRLIARLQERGAAFVHVGNYHGQYHFLGRLDAPIPVIQRRALPAWSRSHPNGYVIAYDNGPPKDPASALHAQPYRGDWLIIWRADQWCAANDIPGCTATGPGAVSREDTLPLPSG